jgi:hypothetical protein
MQDMQEGAYPKKKRRVLLASLPQSSISQKRIAGLRQVLDTSCCCDKVNNVEKQ